MTALFKRLAAWGTTLLTALLVGRILSALAELTLPPLPPTSCRLDLAPQPRYHFSLMAQIPATKSADTAAKPSTQQERCLDGYKLLLTAVERGGGRVLVKKGDAKGAILAAGESLEGWRLEKVAPSFALFKKNGKSCKLPLKRHGGGAAPPSLARAVKTKERPGAVEERYGDQIQREGDTVYIPKELVLQMRDLKAIFSRISIMPKRKGKKLEGFVVTRVARNSIFEKIGLKTRDVIVAIDGRPIKDEKEAMAYFAKIGSISSLSLTIKRHNKQKVLRYEVY